jgi:hypothetical protein
MGMSAKEEAQPSLVVDGTVARGLLLLRKLDSMVTTDRRKLFDSADLSNSEDVADLLGTLESFVLAQTGTSESLIRLAADGSHNSPLVVANVQSWILSQLISDMWLFNDDARQREISLGVLTKLSFLLDSDILGRSLGVIIDDIRARLDSRLGGYDDRKCPGSEAVLGCLDTEGWGTLETSLKALRTMLRCLDSFSIAEFQTTTETIARSIRHPNRYAREQGQYCLAEMLRFNSEFDRICNPQDLLVEGLQDNWSQVRYPSLLALTGYLRESVRRSSVDIISDELITHLLINRHFPAEGIRRLAQEVWRIFTGPQGGQMLLVPRLVPVLRSLSLLIESDNHSQREAIISLSLELARRVVPNVHQPQEEHVSVSLFKLCLRGLEDDAWFIRRVAAELTSILFGQIIRSNPSTLPDTALERILVLLVLDSATPVTHVRLESTQAIRALLHWSLLNGRLHILSTKLITVVKSSVSLDNLKSMFHDSTSKHERHENQPMYSCGSLMSNKQ